MTPWRSLRPLCLIIDRIKPAWTRASASRSGLFAQMEPRSKSRRRYEIPLPSSAVAALALLLTTPTLGKAAWIVSGDALLKWCTGMTGPTVPTPDIQRLSNMDSLDIWLGGSNTGYCYGYIEGIVDAIEQDQQARASNRRTFCIPVGTTASQLGDVAIPYLRGYPAAALRRDAAAEIVSEALQKAFPCR